MMASFRNRMVPRRLLAVAGILGSLVLAPTDVAADAPSTPWHGVTLAQRVTKPSEPPPPAPQPPDVQPRTGVVEPPQPSIGGQPAPTPPAKPGPTAPPPPIELARITFAANSAALSREARAALDKLAATLKANAKMRAALKAYSSTGTSVSEARRLSLQRGTAVRNYLVGKGIAANRLDLQPFGGSEDGGPGDRVDVVQSKS